MRKELGLSLTDNIAVEIYADEDVARSIDRIKDHIARETRSSSITIKKEYRDVSGSLVREWEIDGELFIIGITRVSSTSQ